MADDGNKMHIIACSCDDRRPIVFYGAELSVCNEHTVGNRSLDTMHLVHVRQGEFYSCIAY